MSRVSRSTRRFPQPRWRCRDERTVLRFSHGALDIAVEITLSDFESWIAPDLARMAAAVDAALTDVSLQTAQIDQVFLTGGTSFVPAVRRLFEDRFGAGRVTGGGEFVSVAEGPALICAGRGEKAALF